MAVEEVAGTDLMDDGERCIGDVDSDSSCQDEEGVVAGATPALGEEGLTDVPPQPVQPDRDASAQGGDQAFAAGYLDHGGDPSLLAHLLANVLPCEGGPTFRNDYGNGYISRAQFHPGSWATAVRHTGLNDGANPYHVGANVATWIRLIGGAGPAGTTSGWPVCWHRGR